MVASSYDFFHLLSLIVLSCSELRVLTMSPPRFFFLFVLPSAAVLRHYSCKSVAEDTAFTDSNSFANALGCRRTQLYSFPAYTYMHKILCNRR